eukprot:6188900-Pleurochrysis_carterae.AAC.3
MAATLRVCKKSKETNKTICAGVWRCESSGQDINKRLLERKPVLKSESRHMAAEKQSSKARSGAAWKRD